MTTVTALSSVNDILDSDLVMVTHSNGESYKITGANLKAALITDNISSNSTKAASCKGVKEWVDPSVADFGGQNTQVFLLDEMENQYWEVLAVGYIGNIGNVAGYIMYNDLELRQFNGNTYGTYKPTITYDSSTRKIKINSTGSGIRLKLFGAKHLGWEN